MVITNSISRFDRNIQAGTHSWLHSRIIFATVFSRKNDAVIEDVGKWLNDLQIQLLKLASPHVDITQVTNEIYRLSDEKQKAQVENVDRDDLRKRIAEMSIFLRKRPTVSRNMKNCEVE